MPSTTIGKKIEALLDENELRQSDLAKYLGITRSSVNGWIKGKHSLCSEKLNQVAEFFQVDVKWLKDNKKNYPPEEQYKTNNTDSKIREEVPSLTKILEKDEDHDVEIINENLFRINNPELKSLLAELAEKKDSHKLLTLFGRFIKIVKDEI